MYSRVLLFLSLSLFSSPLFFCVLSYLEQEVAHLSQTGFGAFLEAVQVVAGQDTKSFCRRKRKKRQQRQSATIIQMMNDEQKKCLFYASTYFFFHFFFVSVEIVYRDNGRRDDLAWPTAILCAPWKTPAKPKIFSINKNAWKIHVS